MWFSVVCTLVDNDTRQHSGQNVFDSRGAQWQISQSDCEISCSSDEK